MQKLDLAYMTQVSKGLLKVFSNAFQNTTGDYKKITTEVKANTMSVDYSWIESLPNVREWIGDREVKSLRANLYTITRKKWESTISVERDVIEYDNLGVIKPQIENMAQAALAHYDDLVFGLLEKDENCYDGKHFFAKDHPVGSASCANLFDLELTQANFLKVRESMRKIKNNQGAPLRILPTLLIVPPELEGRALEILTAQTLSQGVSNITYGICKHYVCDRLTNPKAWYLLDASKPLKPIILQINRGVEFVSLDSPKDEVVFLKDAFLYGVRAEHNVGYGLWQMAAKSAPLEAAAK